MEDQDAISRLKEGDLNGLESLVVRYQAKAVHAAYLIVVDHWLAEDIVQSAFIKAAERIHQFKDGRPFGPWFFRMVVNDALKHANKQKRFLSLEAQPDEPTRQLAQWLISPEPQPEQQMALKENRRIILDAIQSLPPGQRAVIVKRYFLDMSEKELASETGRPLSTVKWWLRDARKRLRSLIKMPQGGLE